MRTDAEFDAELARLNRRNEASRILVADPSWSAAIVIGAGTLDELINLIPRVQSHRTTRSGSALIRSATHPIMLSAIRSPGCPVPPDRCLARNDTRE